MEKYYFTGLISTAFQKNMAFTRVTSKRSTLYFNNATKCVYEINIVEKFTNLHIILYSSQDPFENSSGTDTDPTIYFVLDTCA